jgi:hypothetical protein
VIVEPPELSGAVHVKAKVRSPGTTEKSRGALDALDEVVVAVAHEPTPIEVTAPTRNVIEVPFVRPLTV